MIEKRIESREKCPRCTSGRHLYFQWNVWSGGSSYTAIQPIRCAQSSGACPENHLADSINTCVARNAEAKGCMTSDYSALTGTPRLATVQEVHGTTSFVLSGGMPSPARGSVLMSVSIDVVRVHDAKRATIVRGRGTGNGSSHRAVGFWAEE